MIKEDRMADGALLGKNQPELVNCKADEVDAWRAAAAFGGVTSFEAKALYTVAMMRQLAEGAILTLRAGMELPAYVLLADALEAFGRCLTGCQKDGSGSGDRLEAGLAHLLGGVPLRTQAGEYKVEDCKRLRNFVTHGATTPDEQGRDVLDGELTRELIRRLGSNLTTYWAALAEEGEPLREQLADALIRPLFAGGRVVLVEDMHGIMLRPGAEAGGGITI
jgi:hypothetical protein